MEVLVYIVIKANLTVMSKSISTNIVEKTTKDYLNSIRSSSEVSIESTKGKLFSVRWENIISIEISKVVKKKETAIDKKKKKYGVKVKK